MHEIRAEEPYLRIRGFNLLKGHGSADVLIGLDILLDCKTLLDGPARRFTVEF